MTLKRIMAATACILAILGTTFAGGPLNLNPNDPDGVERWANGGVNIPFNPDQGGLGPLNNAAAVQLITDAFQAWEDIPSATSTYSNNGQLAFDIDETNFGPFISNLFTGTNISDGLSPIALDANGLIFACLFGAGTGVLGFASADTFDANGVPIEGVAFLNGGSILQGFPVADFFGVMVHEFGHYSGLAHTVVNGQNVALGDTSGPTPNNTFGNSPLGQVETMYPFAIVGGGESTPHADDIAILSFLYPAASFAAFGTISGLVKDIGGNPLTGVNVIARNVANPFVDAVSAISGDRGVTGAFTINGLDPNGQYVLFVDQILQGGFSTTPAQLPGPEDFFPDAGPANPITPDANIMFQFQGPGPGDPLAVGDDGNVEVALPFPFELCGQSFDSVFINANGNITFGAPSGDFSESAADHLSGPPRVAGFWDDLNPSQGGVVFFTQTDKRFQVHYENVPEFFSTGANSFVIELERSNHHIELSYGALSALDGLAGVSCGGLVTSGFEPEVDLTGLGNGRINLEKEAALYEVFTDFDNDLSGALLRFTGTKTFKDKFEKNDSIKKAEKIELPFDSISTKEDFTEIRPSGDDVDYFEIEDLEVGETLVAEILTGQIDTVMGLFLKTGEDTGVLVAADDDGGAGLLSRLVFEIPQDGDYVLAVSTFPDFDFSGDGAGEGRYVLSAFAVNGQVLDLGDDDSVTVDIGFNFPFQGGVFTQVSVNSNGSLTFNGGDTDFSESVSEFLNENPRVAPLWDDLSPNQGGLIIVTRDGGDFAVTFMDVPEFLGANSNNFTCTFSPDGSIAISYGTVDASDGLVGVTEGGAAADPGPTDLSAAGSLSASGTTYELFNFGNSFDLANLALLFSLP